MFFALRSRVAGLGFFGLGVGLGVMVIVLGCVAAGVRAEVSGDGVDSGDGVATGDGGDGVSDGDGVSAGDGVATGVDWPGAGSDSDAVALDELTLITPKIPPATRAKANKAVTGISRRGSFTSEVCHETPKYGVLAPRNCPGV